MKLSELKLALSKVDGIQLYQADGMPVPVHFHITEVGHIQKNFIDCGGTVRLESRIGLQLWYNEDTSHRLTPERLLHIIDLSEKALNIPNEEIEVEYQAETISKYGLAFDGIGFHLTSTHTACLAEDQCAPMPKRKLSLATLTDTKSQCDGTTGCC